MTARRALLLVGSFWELVRFFLVLLLFAVVLQESADAGPWVFPWLLVVGSGNLLIAAGAGMLALFPDRYGRLIAFLRLGKVMSVFSLVLLLVSGALRGTATREALGMGRVAITRGAALLGVFVVDLFFLGVLFAWRREENTTNLPPGPAASSLPEYKETEVGDYH